MSRPLSVFLPNRRHSQENHQQMDNSSISSIPSMDDYDPPTPKRSNRPRSIASLSLFESRSSFSKAQFPYLPGIHKDNNKCIERRCYHDFSSSLPPAINLVTGQLVCDNDLQPTNQETCLIGREEPSALFRLAHMLSIVSIMACLYLLQLPIVFALTSSWLIVRYAARTTMSCGAASSSNRM